MFFGMFIAPIQAMASLKRHCAAFKTKTTTGWICELSNQRYLLVEYNQLKTLTLHKASRERIAFQLAMLIFACLGKFVKHFLQNRTNRQAPPTFQGIDPWPLG